MVVIHRAFGFRIVIYTSDHEPAHVHVTGPGQAKVDLIGPDGRPRLVWMVGINRADMARPMSEIDDRRSEFLSAWERIHGRIDRS